MSRTRNTTFCAAGIVVELPAEFRRLNKPDRVGLLGVWRAPDAGLAVGTSDLAAADDRSAALAIVDVLESPERLTHPCQLAIGPAVIALSGNTFQLFLPRCESRQLIVLSLSARTGAVAYYAARLGRALAGAREISGLIGVTALCS